MAFNHLNQKIWPNSCHFSAEKSERERRRETKREPREKNWKKSKGASQGFGQFWGLFWPVFGELWWLIFRAKEAAKVGPIWQEKPAAKGGTKGRSTKSNS